MEEDGRVSSKVATCLYMSREVVEAARRIGLNLSRVSENALVEAVGRLRGTDTRNGPGNVVRGVGFEPTNPCGIAASGLRLWPCLATPASIALSTF